MQDKGNTFTQCRGKVRRNVVFGTGLWYNERIMKENSSPDYRKELLIWGIAYE